MTNAAHAHAHTHPGAQAQDGALTEVSDFSAGGYSEDSASGRGGGAAGGGGSGVGDGSGNGAAAAAPPAVEGTRRGVGLSFTGKDCHESVRVIIPDRGERRRCDMRWKGAAPVDRGWLAPVCMCACVCACWLPTHQTRKRHTHAADDPITAAIMRSAESFTASPTRTQLCDAGGDAGGFFLAAPSPRARSFCVAGGPGVAGARPGPSKLAGAAAGGPLPSAPPGGGSPGGGRGPARGGVPPLLSPSDGGGARGGSGGGGARGGGAGVPAASAAGSPGGAGRSGAPPAGERRGAPAATDATLKSRVRSLAGGGGARGAGGGAGGGGGSGGAPAPGALPPIPRGARR